MLNHVQSQIHKFIFILFTDLFCFVVQLFVQRFKLHSKMRPGESNLGIVKRHRIELKRLCRVLKDTGPSSIAEELLLAIVIILRLAGVLNCGILGRVRFLVVACYALFVVVEGFVLDQS